MIEMRVLVTGAAGFLGRHVARRFRMEGHETTGFDTASADGEDFPSLRGDLLDLDQLVPAARGSDVICHIGAIGDVYLAAEQPALAAQVNVTGTTNVATAASRVGARVVYASTWEVYGKPAYEPVDEEHPCRPDHPYNITKLAGEQMLLAAGRLKDLPVLSLRLGTTYGLGLRSNSVFRIFVDRARRGERIVIHGDGSQGRQFTHASDVARAFVMAAESDLHGLSLNTVGTEMISIKQLAETVVDRYPTELTFGEARPGDVPTGHVSSAKIKRLMGWEPQVSFDQGLAELLDDARRSV